MAINEDLINKNKKGARLSKIAQMVYVAVLAVMVLMVAANILLKEPKQESYGLESYISLDDQWTTADGEKFEISKIDKFRTDNDEGITVYHTITKSDLDSQTLIFRSKNCFVDVRCGGEELYQTAVSEAPFYNHSMGTRWNVVNLGHLEDGETVEIQVRQAYEDGRAKIDNFYLGDGSAIIIKIISDKLFGCIISLVMLFVGILFFCAWIVLNLHRRPRDNSLLWLSLFAMVAATWSLLETNLLQLFVRDLRLLQVIDNMMLVAGGVPLYFYLNSMYGAFRLRSVRILCTLDILYVAAATVCQMAGLWDYHQTLNGAVINYGVVVVLLIGFVIRRWRVGNEKKKYRRTRVDGIIHYLQPIGLLLLGLGVFGDLARYLMMDVMDRAFTIRICLLLFVILFGAGNIYHMMHLVQKGLQADLISRLAYSDGLTGVGNRTAYQEHLEELAERHPAEEILFVMLDINNLKQVNDAYGHQSGDDMIVACANRMKETLGTVGEVYRIGGDEFVVLIQGTDVEKTYDSLMQNFDKENEDRARAMEAEYPISIAYGAALCKEVTAEGFQNAEREADACMYKKKYTMKQAEKQKEDEKGRAMG